MPLGVFIIEDPRCTPMHRLLSVSPGVRARCGTIEDQIRSFCAACLDPLVGGDRFDFTLDLGAEMPIRVVGILVGIPDSLQRSVRTVAGRRFAQQAGRTAAGQQEQLLQRQHVSRLRGVA